MPPIISNRIGITLVSVVGLLLISIYLFYGIENVPLVIEEVPASSQVSGTFKGQYAIGGARGKTGGACLIFQDAQQPQTCAVAAEEPCPNPQSAITGSFNLHGYCVPPDDDPKAKSGTCWFKPMDRRIQGNEIVWDDSRHCRKGVALPGGPYTLNPVDKYPPGTDRGVRWRVITCQNDGLNSLCKDGKGISKYGLASDFEAKP